MNPHQNAADISVNEPVYEAETRPPLPAAVNCGPVLAGNVDMNIWWACTGRTSNLKQILECRFDVGQACSKRGQAFPTQGS